MTGVSNHVLETLRKQIRLQMNDIADNLIGGNCKDFADYTHQVGQIKGLAGAERELIDLAEKIENA